MIKSIGVPSVILLIIFCTSYATLSAEITIVQNQGINFGRILSSPGRSCTMDALTGSLSGAACYDMSGTKGIISITGDPDTMVDIELIPGVSSNNLAFTPRLEGGGTLTSVSLSGEGSRSVNIGGILETDPVTEPSSGPVTLIYTIRVDYQ